MASGRARSPSLLGSCDLPSSAYVQPPCEPLLIDLEDSDDEVVECKPLVKPEVKEEYEDDESDSEIEFLGYSETEKRPQETPETCTGEAVDDLSRNGPSSSETNAFSAAGSKESGENDPPPRRSMPSPPPPPIFSLHIQEPTLGPPPCNETITVGDQGHIPTVRKSMPPPPPPPSLSSHNPTISSHLIDSFNVEGGDEGDTDQNDNEETDPLSPTVPVSVVDQIQQARSTISTSPGIDVDVEDTGDTDQNDDDQTDSLSPPVPVPVVDQIQPSTSTKSTSTGIDADGEDKKDVDRDGNETDPPTVPYEITVTFGPGHKETYVSTTATAKSSKEAVHKLSREPRMVSGSCQTSESIFNGEAVKKTSVDVTAPVYRQDGNSRSMDNSFKIPHSSRSMYQAEKAKFSEEQESGGNKQYDERDRNDEADRYTDTGTRSTKEPLFKGQVPARRIAHQSKGDRHDRSHDAYIKTHNRRHSVKDTNTPTKVPKQRLFRTEEDLIILLRRCFDCNDRYESRKDGATHQKMLHNKRHCPVCFELLSCKGNAWKDHLNEDHSIESKEVAKCPFCRKEYSFEGMYQHISRVHLIPREQLPINFPPTLSRNVSPTEFSRSPSCSRHQTPQQSSAQNMHSSTSSSRHPQGPSHRMYPSKTTSTHRPSQPITDKLKAPNIPSFSARKDSLRSTKVDHRYAPYPNPRNAGVTPSSAANTTFAKCASAVVNQAARTDQGRSTSHGQPSGSTGSAERGTSTSTNAETSKNAQSQSSTSSSQHCAYSTSKSTFSLRQLERLGVCFRQNPTPGNPDLIAIANLIGARDDEVAAWFLRTYKSKCESDAKSKPT